MAHFVLESHAVELVSTLQQLRAEGGGDELSILSKTVDHGCIVDSTKEK